MKTTFEHSLKIKTFNTSKIVTLQSKTDVTVDLSRIVYKVLLSWPPPSH